MSEALTVREESEPRSVELTGARTRPRAVRPPTPHPFEPPPPRFGRYFVIEKLGAGGMGMVYRAYDPKLCREIALKVLRPEALDKDSEARMFREARAMAQLAHPNVLPVYDVDTDPDRETVYMAMELVRGQNLAEWLAAASRDYREVLRVFRDAAAGLSAAHAHGLVHRDFKLANVLIGHDGRVRVMDFGLAKGLEGSERLVEDTPVGFEITPDVGAPLRAEITRQGVVMGTPAYMAPEQFRGRPATHASDQYAFCVALYEALYGVRPFVAKNYRELARLKKDASVPQPPEPVTAPRWLFPIVARGLARDPEDRYASMDELAALLHVDPSVRGSRRRRRRRVMLGGGVVLIGGLVAALAGAFDVDRCTSQVDAVDRLWDDRAQRQTLAAFREAAGGDAGAAQLGWDAVDAYVDRLRGSVRGSCERAVVKRSVPQEVYAKQLACYGARRRDLGALVEVFATPDAEVLRKAVDAVAGLDPVALCEDEAYVMAKAAPPPASLAGAVAQLEARLSRVEAQERAGRYAAATSMLDPIGVEAEELDYAALRVEVALARGRLLAQTDHLDAARRVLHEAYFAAAEHALHDPAAEAARELAYLEGHTERDFDAGTLWLRHASVDTQLGSRSAVLEAELWVTEGNLLEKAGKLREAGQRYDRAHAVFTAQFGPDHPRSIRLLYNRGNVARSLGRTGDGDRLLREALDVAKRVLGPEHPLCGRIWDALGLVSLEHGDALEAAKMHRRASTIFAASLGESNQLVAMAALNEAVAYSHLEAVEDAVSAYDRARSIFAEVLGPDHPNVAAVLNNLGALYAQLERHDEAQPYLEEALRLSTSRLGPDHPDVADARGNLGLNLCHQGETVAGLEHTRAALEILRARLGEVHPRVAQAYVNIGYCQRRAGDPKSALARYARAASIRREISRESGQSLGADYAVALAWQGKLELETGRLSQSRGSLREALEVYESVSSTSPRVLALARFDLARALWASGERDDAIALLDQARTSLTGLPPEQGTAELAALDGWMAIHDVTP